MSLTAWLDLLRPGAGARLGPMLAALPGRPTFEGAVPSEPQARALACTEWSVREGRPGLRWAFTLDTDRLPRGWLAAALRRLHPELPGGAELEALRAADPDLGLLLGLDEGEDTRAKLYLYPEGRRAPVERLARLAGLDVARWWREVWAPGLPLPFVAVDLLPGRVGDLKAYLGAADRRAAAEALRRFGDEALARRAEALPAEIEQDLHALVVTPRWGAAGRVDVTLHARVHRAPGLADGPLGEEIDRLRGQAEALGLELRLTHLSWLSTGARTAYYQLVVR